MPKIRAILFDLDNTLIDFLYMKEESCKAAVHAMVSAGLQMDEDEAFRRLLETYFLVGIESDTAFSEFLKSQGQFSHKILAAAINAYLERKNQCLKPYPNVEATLEALKQKDVFLAVVTDAPKTKAYQRLMSMNLERYFRFVVGYEDTNRQKHTGLPLLHALSLVKKELPDISNDEILMVGDSLEKDVAPAGKLGLKTAWSKYGQRSAQQGTPDFTLKDIADLTRYID